MSSSSVMKKEKIIGIVVAYNISFKDLYDNIKSYEEYVNEIVIVDNSDKDNDISNNIAANDKDNIHYINMKGNYGIAKALNTGISYGIKKKYEYALTMDQDSIFENNLIKVYQNYTSKDVIIYSPYYEIERKGKHKNKKNIEELYWTMTSGNIINLELYKECGEFLDKLFIDVVDYEYCLRARKKGYRILGCNEAILKHNPGITKTKRILFWNYKYGYMSPTRMYYQVRNLSYVAREYHSLKAYLLLFMKYMKIVLLFPNKQMFFKAYKLGRQDFKNSNYGKLGVEKW